MGVKKLVLHLDHLVLRGSAPVEKDTFARDLAARLRGSLAGSDRPGTVHDSGVAAHTAREIARRLTPPPARRRR